MRLPRFVDEYLERRTRAELIVLAALGIVLVGGVDYLTGHEMSMSLFYLGPVATAGWYAGRRVGVMIAAISAAVWFGADLAAGGEYSIPAIRLWNALVRLGFFAVVVLLLGALRESLLANVLLARTDGLTALYNRRAFEDRLKHDVDLAKRRRGALSLAYVDMDDFKAINDLCGHSEGDRVLRLVGDALRAALRAADTAARIGGDEFAVILPDTDLQEAKHVVARLRRELSRTLAEQGMEVTCSVGVVTMAENAATPEGLLEAADKLMYEIKGSGKNNVSFRIL